MPIADPSRSSLDLPTLERSELIRILSTQERNVLVMVNRDGNTDAGRRHIAQALGIGLDELDEVYRGVERKVQDARVRKAAQLGAERAEAERAEPPQVRDEPEPQNGRRKPVLVPRAVELLREHGPMRQAELRRLLGVSSSQMATWIVPGLRRAGVLFGEVVERSPMLRLAEHVDEEAEPDETSGPAGTAAGVPADEPPADDAEVRADAPVGPEDALRDKVARQLDEPWVDPARTGARISAEVERDEEPSVSTNGHRGIPVTAEEDEAFRAAPFGTADVPECGECGQPDGQPWEHAVECSSYVSPCEADRFVRSTEEFVQRFGRERPVPSPPEPPPPTWDPVAQWAAYVQILCELARENPTVEHLFDRIERLMGEGPPRARTEAA